MGDALLWACACGARVFNHYEFCGACGKSKPAPPPEPKPQAKPLTGLDSD